MMKTEKVDIIVAVHNGERYLRKCANALLKTEYDNKNIIFIDDGSDDKTAEILKQLSLSYPIIKVLSKSQGGVSDARNFGINSSKAKYVAITDVDCQVAENWLQESIKHFKNSDIGAVTGWLHYRVTNVLSAVREAEYYVRFDKRSRKALAVSCPVCVFKKEVLKDIGGFDTSFKVGGEDTEIGYRLVQNNHKIIYEKNMVAYHSSEEDLFLYLKRNFRNAVNHIILLKKRKFSRTFSDDFFPLILRLQPLFTLIFICSFILLYFLKNIFLVFINIICVFFIFYNFCPVIKKTTDLKGLKSIIPAFIYLMLRNITWMFGLIIGVVRSLLK